MSDFDEFDSFDDFDLAEFDDAPADDDVFDSFDDDVFDDPVDDSSADTPSAAEVSRRLDEYEKKTTDYRRRIVKAKQFNKEQRAEAVEWLGESGNPLAIPELIKVYRKDKTPGMKEKAAYALGQMKALQQQLNDPETEAETSQRIYDMVTKDQYGKSASAIPLIIIEVVLVVVAIVLFIVGGILNANAATQRAENEAATQTAMPTPTMDTIDALQNDLNTYYTALVEDSVLLQQDLNQVGRGNEMTCDTDALQNPSPYTLSPQWETQYSDVVTQLNDFRTELNTIRQPYLETCSGGLMNAEEANSLLDTLVGIQLTFNDLSDALNDAGIEVPEPAIPTQPPLEETDEPQATPLPVDTADLNAVIIDLERLITDMTDLQGSTSQINFYWQQVVDNGELYISGCNQPPPIVPEDYELDASLVGISTDLDTAVSNVNIALSTTRDAINAFYAACEAGEVPENAAGQLTITQFSLDTFGVAQNNLSEVER